MTEKILQKQSKALSVLFLII